jgi:type I restriction enzyme S subunit
MKKDWEIKKLIEVCEVITKGTTPTSLGFKFTDEGVNFIKVESLTESGQIIPNKVAYISEECHESLKRSQLKENDILFSIAGALGRIGIVNKAIVPANTNQALAIVRLAKNSGISVSFLAKYFTSNIISEEIEKLKGGAAQQNLSLGQLNNLPIPIPSLPEQQRIVAVLDEAFAAIAKAKDNAEQNLKNAKELFDVYLHKYYSSKEDGWEEKKLKEVAEYFNGLTYSPKNVSNEGIIVLRSSNVQNDELDFKDIVRVNLSVKEKIIVKEGDILMCSRNGSARLVGKTATIKNLNEEMTFGTFMMIIRSPFNSYLSWFFKSTDFRNQIKGGENNMINQITRYMLDDVVISFPPIEKQNEVVRQLDALSIEIKKLETIYQQKINNLEELKKSLLQKAFSGELKI